MTRRRSFFGIAALWVLFGPSLPAQGAWQPATWSVTPAVASHHFFRGVKLSGPALQPGVELESGPFVAGVWASLPFRSGPAVGISGREINLYGRYAVPVGDAVAVAAGFTWYHYSGSARGTGFARPAFEPYVELDYTVAGLRLTPTFHYDVERRGTNWQLEAAYAVPLLKLGTELNFTGVIGTYRRSHASAVPGHRITNTGDHWLLGVAVPYQVSLRARLLVGWSYAAGSNNTFQPAGLPRVSNPAAVGRGIFMAACRFGF